MDALEEIFCLDDAILGLGGGFPEHGQTSTSGNLGLGSVVESFDSHQVSE